MDTPLLNPRVVRPDGGTGASANARSDVGPAQRIGSAGDALLERYRIDHETARTEAGVVYDATEIGSLRRVSLEIANAIESDDARARFQRDALLAQRLESEHVLRVFGTKATFIHDDAGARLHLARDPGGPPRVIDQAPVAATKGELVPSFIDAILAGNDPAPSARHEYAVVTACLAQVKSQFPDENRITIAPDSTIAFQHLIEAMDAVKLNGTDVLFEHVLLAAGVR